MQMKTIGFNSADVDQFFKTLDTDSSGSLDVAELQKAFKQVDAPCTCHMHMPHAHATCCKRPSSRWMRHAPCAMRHAPGPRMSGRASHRPARAA